MSYEYEIRQAMQNANSAFDASRRCERLAEAKRKEDKARENIAHLLDSTNEANARLTAQMTLLEKQLVEAKAANTALEKQASSSAKSAKFSQWIAVVSAVIALASFIVALLK